MAPPRATPPRAPSWSRPLARNTALPGGAPVVTSAAPRMIVRVRAAAAGRTVSRMREPLVTRAVLALLLASCGDATNPAPSTDASVADAALPASGNSASGTVGATIIAIAGSGVGGVQNNGQLLGVVLSGATIACGSTVVGPDVPYLRIHVGVRSGMVQPGTYDGSAGVLEAYVESFPNPCRSTRVNPVAKNDGLLARSVTITSLSATRAAGTFRIRMYNPNQQQGDVTGSFDVPLCAPGTASARCM